MGSNAQILVSNNLFQFLLHLHFLSETEGEVILVTIRLSLLRRQTYKRSRWRWATVENTERWLWVSKGKQCHRGWCRERKKKPALLPKLAIGIYWPYMSCHSRERGLTWCTDQSCLATAPVLVCKNLLCSFFSLSFGKILISK